MNKRPVLNQTVGANTLYQKALYYFGQGQLAFGLEALKGYVAEHMADRLNCWPLGATICPDDGDQAYRVDRGYEPKGEDDPVNTLGIYFKPDIGWWGGKGHRDNTKLYLWGITSKAQWVAVEMTARMGGFANRFPVAIETIDLRVVDQEELLGMINPQEILEHLCVFIDQKVSALQRVQTMRDCLLTLRDSFYYKPQE